MNKVPGWVWGLGALGLGYVLYSIIKAHSANAAALAQGIADQNLRISGAAQPSLNVVPTAGAMNVSQPTLVNVPGFNPATMVAPPEVILDANFVPSFWDVVGSEL
jgi:hypothetical protein